jgi:hypothetical protein
MITLAAMHIYLHNKIRKYVNNQSYLETFMSELEFMRLINECKFSIAIIECKLYNNCKQTERLYYD